MGKIFSIFNARNNWKTTIVIFPILSIALILMICILPTQIDINGEYKYYYLFGYGENSLYQVRKDVEAAPNKFLWTFSYVYIYFIAQQLLAILGWFFVLNFFVVIHFTLIKKPNRRIRLVNSLILFFASIILVVSVVNYMVAYVQIIRAYTEILGVEVGKTRLGKAKQAVMFVLAFQFFIISAWNLHVERKTEYRFNTELKIKREKRELRKAKKTEKKLKKLQRKKKTWKKSK